MLLLKKPPSEFCGTSQRHSSREKRTVPRSPAAGLLWVLKLTTGTVQVCAVVILVWLLNIGSSFHKEKLLKTSSSAEQPCRSNVSSLDSEPQVFGTVAEVSIFLPPKKDTQKARPPAASCPDTLGSKACAPISSTKTKVLCHLDGAAASRATNRDPSNTREVQAKRPFKCS